jgi:hypothetical protein
MQIGVTCITGSQSVIEACRRIIPEVDRLNERVSQERISTGYSHMLVSFVDKDDDYLRLVPNRDAILQAQTGYIPEALARGTPKEELIEYVKGKLARVIERAKLGRNVQERLLVLVREWRAGD